jgi:mono/diheme cytochrome c family protein
MHRIAVGAFALLIAASLTAPALAQEEPAIKLKDGQGLDRVEANCAACHSLDYIQMNSRFLDKNGWTASVNKMINAFGAPIQKEDVEAIATYLSENYGKAPAK